MSPISRSIHDLICGRQYNRILRMSFPNNDAPRAQFLVNRLEAVEHLSEDFEFAVELLSDDAGVALKEMQGKLLTIELVRVYGSLRYFSDYVFSFQRRRSDGSITFYEARLGPWLKLLGLRKDNCLFHGKTLREQTQSVFQDYGIYPVWNWRVTADDPVMTDARQFDETDFNYLSRRWETAGSYCWYEHDAHGHKIGVGSDSTQAPSIDGAWEVGFHATGGAQEEDAIDRWSLVRPVMPSQVALSSFNFKHVVPAFADLPTLNQQGAVPDIESYEYAGAYGFRNLRDGDAQTRLRMEEIEAVGKRVDAEGNDRYLMPGRWFQLKDHFNYSAYRQGSRVSDNEYLTMPVRHVATNNYLQEENQKIQYRNWFTCSRRNMRWRPSRNFSSRNTRILAPQTAIVVGPSGQDSLHTDKYGRVRVQLHWDRTSDSDERNSAWIRVSSVWAGSEVIVQWVGGCPDRPIITGAVINERNMTPWTVPAQQALTGLRSRGLHPNASDSAGDRSNHLILDDTNGQIQAQIKSDHQCRQLSLGYITRIQNTQGRTDARGEGWEIATDAWGVARAGKGMLITTEARPNATCHTKEMSETVQRLTAARGIQESQAEMAAQHGAQEKQGQKSGVAAALKARIDAVRGKCAGSDNAAFAELSEPQLILASPAGIASTTAQSTHIASDIDTAVTTGKSIALAASDGLFASIRQTFRLFVQKAGMKLVAAGGDIDVKALTDSIHLLAGLNITQTANRIVISAKEDIVINGGGSYAKFSANGIEHGTTGTFITHTATHDFVSAKSMAQPDLKSDVVDVVIKRDLHLEYVDADGNALQHDPIQAMHGMDSNMTPSWMAQERPSSTTSRAARSVLNRSNVNSRGHQ
jgi:type VI secretion system secreted protein VgrG